MKTINITIENKLNIEKRDINIYHSATRSSHMISYNSSVTLPLYSQENNDYLYLAIVCGPGSMSHWSTVNLPAWLNFEFLSEGKLTVQHTENRTLLNIPPGLPNWQLKLTHSLHKKNSDTITIKEN